MDLEIVIVVVDESKCACGEQANVFENGGKYCIDCYLKKNCRR